MLITSVTSTHTHICTRESVRCESAAHLSLRGRCFWVMDCPVIVIVGSASSGLDTELHPLGRRSRWHVQEDTRFLAHRFPGFCPHHILHNLLGLHYSRHESCTAAPFSDQRCRHGSHQRPGLSREEMIHAAPAEGAVIFLPYGLSRRAGDGLLVAGCADCERLLEGDVCGACRRRWNAGADHPTPANGYPGLGRLASLAGWRAAVDLTGEQAEEGPVAEESGEESEEEWGEEEWEGEGEDEDLEDVSDEWEDAHEGYTYEGDAYEGDAADGGAWNSGDAPRARGRGGAPATSRDWGDGQWVEDRQGSWAWVVDFAAPAAASTVPAANAPAPGVAAAAAAAAVQAVLTAGAVPAASSVAASAPGLSERIRVLELELELERLKAKRRRLA